MNLILTHTMSEMGNTLTWYQLFGCEFFCLNHIELLIIIDILPFSKYRSF